MSASSQQQTFQPTFSGYDVDGEKPFLPSVDAPCLAKQSSISLNDEGQTPSGDADDDGASGMSLADLLRERMLCDETSGLNYMPLHLLHAVMPRHRVVSELQSHYEVAQVQEYANLICPEGTRDQSLGIKVAGVYTKVFATLIRLNKCQDIGKFVGEGLSDDKLPFGRRDGTLEMKRRFPLFENAASVKEIHACKHWRADDRERFFAVQREFLVHFFRHRPARDEDSVKEMGEPTCMWVDELSNTTYLPWKERRMNTSRTEGLSIPHMSSSYAGGAYGGVSPFEIDDGNHDFMQLLEGVGLDGKVFAVKTLRRITRTRDHPELPPRDETDEEMRVRFRKEVAVLWRLDGTVHPHLLTMLTAFEHNDGHLQLRFVFPWAECDLLGLWQLGDTSWKWDAASFIWMAEQIDGILGAVEKLHEPAHLHELEHDNRRYGLHADIKPDNILLFRSQARPRGILVLSDFGLSSFHREITRSNIPNNKVMGTPAYNPPECDVQGGLICRRYDIWTLGSLFLDMLTWLLGGEKLLDDFQNFVEVQYITGGLRKMFYQICELQSQGTGSVHIRDGIIKDTDRQKWYGIQLNPKLTQWIQLLKSREGCSGLVKDILTLIEEKMLRLQASERWESKHLKREFTKILSRCYSHGDYVFSGSPKPQHQGNIPQSLSGTLVVQPTPVYIAPLKAESYQQIRANQQSLRLPVHSVTENDQRLKF